MVELSGMCILDFSELTSVAFSFQATFILAVTRV